MTDHTIGTREEWLAAREQLLVRENEQAPPFADQLQRPRGGAVLILVVASQPGDMNVH